MQLKKYDLKTRVIAATAVLFTLVIGGKIIIDLAMAAVAVPIIYASGLALAGLVSFTPVFAKRLEAKKIEKILQAARDKHSRYFNVYGSTFMRFHDRA